MQLMVIYGLLVSFVLAKICDAQISCKDGNNEDIDWFIILKSPSSYKFQYLSSKNKQWKLSKEDISSDRNMLAHTLRQAPDTNTFYANYNDDFNSLSKRRGHLNGFLRFDITRGYWIIHSVPTFIPTTKYEYPQTGKINGQSFICVTVNTEYLEGIASQLLLMKSTVYSYNLPQNMFQNQLLMEMLQNLGENKNVKIEKSSNFIELKTSDNSILYHLAKSKEYQKELYTDFISPFLESSLYVETWRLSKSLPSNCANVYKVYNVNFVRGISNTYKYTQDHSKWAVTISENKPYICIGDINRMKTKTRRGGGSLCIKDLEAWRSFKTIVAYYEECHQSDF